MEDCFQFLSGVTSMRSSLHTDVLPLVCGTVQLLDPTPPLEDDDHWGEWVAAT